MKLFLSSLLILLSFNVFSDSKFGRKMEMMKATQVDDLIRGEMSAVKSYNQILSDITDQQEKVKLEKIKADHEMAVAKLKSYATKDVREDTRTAGAWGTFAQAWTGGAKLMGNKVALKALTQGEKHGINEYKEALKDKNVNPELKELIRTQFIPKQEEHLKTINSLL
jgi:glutaredoxin-related protein